MSKVLDKSENSLSSFSMEKYRSELLNFFAKNKMFIVQAPTGAGKTLGIPIILSDLPEVNKITVAVNNNISAFRANAFISKYRLNSVITYIPIQTLVTDILRGNKQLLGDVLIVDEFHTNTVWVSSLLGILNKKRILGEGSRIIFSSATADFSDLRLYLPKIKVLNLQQREHEIKFFFKEQGFNPLRERKQLDDIIIKLIEEREFESNGIIFRSGIKEVMQLVNKLRSKPNFSDHLIIPVYSANFSDITAELKEAENRENKTIIVGTNFIESSVTFPNADYVISDMLEKFMRRSRLEISIISERSAQQRAGRVGRTKNGRAYFLIGTDVFKNIPKYKIRDVEKANIDDVVLHLIQAKLDPRSILLLDDKIYFDISIDLQKKGLVNKDNQLTTLGIMTKELSVPSEFLKLVTYRFESDYEETVQELQKSQSCIAMCAILSEFRNGIIPSPTVEKLLTFWWTLHTNDRASIKNLSSKSGADFKIWLRINTLYHKIHRFMLKNSDIYQNSVTTFGNTALTAGNLEEYIKYVENVFVKTQERMYRVGINLYINDDDKYYKLSEIPLNLPDVIFVGNKFETYSSGYINLYLASPEQEEGYPLLDFNEDNDFMLEVNNL